MSLTLATSAFLEGYRLARLHEDPLDPPALLDALLELGRLRTPFAVEGAAMAWRLRDEQDDGPRRSDALMTAAACEWHPFLDLGVGCALARIGQEPPTEPTILDGYGFQLGLLVGVSGFRTPAADPHSERGRGRALWFTTGGEARACAGAIANATHPDGLWRGVGTACAFAGDPRNQAAHLPGLALEFADDVRAGAESALTLWRSLGGDPPERVLVVLRALR